MRCSLRTRLKIGFSLVLASLLFPKNAIAAIHLELSGSTEGSTLYYEYEETVKTKASLAIDLGSFLRVSASGLKSIETTTGYKRISEDPSEPFYEFKAQTTVTGMSLDLMAIIFASEHVMPFVFAGGVRKNYEMRVYIANGTSGSQKGATPWMPNYGAGVSFSLSKNFSMKLTHTRTIGQKVDPLTSRVSLVQDGSTALGISYKIGE